jgi:hypothetical protein
MDHKLVYMNFFIISQSYLPFYGAVHAKIAFLTLRMAVRRFGAHTVSLTRRMIGRGLLLPDARSMARRSHAFGSTGFQG